MKGSNISIYHDDENTNNETPSDENTDDQAKETETDAPTEKKNDNKQLGTTANEDGVRRSTILKA